uniref:Uncharacterized protein n=1 Tax=Clastoptera arizonana TaxID=38151 RepID=A0A1B6DSX9_9HEMI
MATESDVLSEFKYITDTIWNSLKENNVDKLKPKEFRVIINLYKKTQAVMTEIPELSQLSEGLLKVLTTSNLDLDRQIIASTALCLTLSHEYNSENIFDKFFELLTVESFQNQNNIIDANKYLLKICLCYGILQCNYSFWSVPCNVSNVNKILNEIFSFVVNSYHRNKNLYLTSFKVLVNVVKKINILEQSTISLSDENFKKVLQIVMSNWENSMPGVREQISLLLNQILQIDKDWGCLLSKKSHLFGDDKYFPILQLIFMEQSWMMKSKYFLLSTILPICGIKKVLAMWEKDILDGLLLSLNFPQLVSAGADLYQVIISNFTIEQWIKIFLIPITEVLSQSSNRLLNENVINYWIPDTIKKYPTSVEYLIDKILNDGNEINLFSYLSLMKIVRKEGFEYANWEFMSQSKLLFSGLLSDCDKTRSQAFHFVCVSSKTSISPSEDEIKLVKMFLKQNINNDNTAMRQSLLNGFTKFLLRLRDSSLKADKRNESEGSNQALENCLNFLEWLHNFVSNNCKFDCNYQRKHTSLQIYKIILHSLYSQLKLSTVKTSYRKDLDVIITNKKCKFISKESRDLLMDNIYDPVDDIRTLSSYLLTTYFKIEKSEIKHFKELLLKSIKQCQHKMFYEAESGALFFETTLMLIFNSEFPTLDDILPVGMNDSVIYYLVNIIEENLKHLSDDFLQAVMTDSSLYGLLVVLNKLCLNRLNIECLKLSYFTTKKIMELTGSIVTLLLQMLSSQSDPTSDFAPSFAEMGMAISSLVDNSVISQTYTIREDVNFYESKMDLQLTPSQQLILNCIWHHIKICCNLASTLITSSLLDQFQAEKCMDLLCLVLCKCRHKGAIESAGLAIRTSTMFLTSRHKVEYRSIPHNLLMKFLSRLVSANSTTVSRRSAGLALLVHHMVVGDMEPNKPLLHICISKFKEIFDGFSEPTDTPLADLPQAQALHFLQTLVQDSSLKQDMTKYIVEISLLCFSNLGSSVWTLRNAALQLFGALVPKLTGQKMVQDGEYQNICYHLPIEEIYFEFTLLFDMMYEELLIAKTTNSLKIHSKIMPLLTLISNLTVSFYNHFNPKLNEVCEKFSLNLLCLFKSEIYNVRILSAKSNAWFCLPSKIVNCIQNRVTDVVGYILKAQSKITNTNDLHGYLLNIKYLVHRFNEIREGNKILQNYTDTVNTSLDEITCLLDSDNLLSQHHLIYSLVLELVGDKYNGAKLKIGNIVDICCNISNNLGIVSWAYFHLHSEVNTCNIDKIRRVLNLCMASNNFNIQKHFLNALKTRITKSSFDRDFIFLIYDLNKFLCKTGFESQIIDLILQIMFNILSSSDVCLLSEKIDTEVFYSFINNRKCSVLALPVTCGIISKLPYTFHLVEKMSIEIFERSNSVHEELRLSSAMSLYFLFLKFKTITQEGSDQLGAYIFKSVVTLIQDENRDIRLHISRFVCKVFCRDFKNWLVDELKLNSCILNISTFENSNPFTVFEFLFTPAVLKQFMSETHQISTLWEMIGLEINSQINSDDSSLNPFSKNKINIYEEEVILIEMIHKSILDVIKNLTSQDFFKVKSIILEKLVMKDKDCDQRMKLNRLSNLDEQKLIAQSLIVDALTREY